MQTTFAVLAALATAAFALPQSSSTTPEGCQSSYDGKFQYTIVNASTTVTKRDLISRQATTTCGDSNLLEASLTDGVLTDSQGRIGNVVANTQFQFDPAPGQPDALYTSGFSVCQNGSLSIGGSSVFYSCASGEFANLYTTSIAPYCKEIFIVVLPCGQATPSGEFPASAQPDGQPTAATSVAPVTQITDGQVQAPTTAPVTQITDGQLQVPTMAPMAPVTQIADGQLQVATSGYPMMPAVTQIGDGQLQAPTVAPTVVPSAPVTQIGDGQLQVPTSAPVTQIGDGQLQVPTSAPAVTQIGDGQLQVPTSAPAVTQIGDGQLQAPTNASVTTAPVTVGASAGNSLVSSGLAIVGLVAVLLL